MFAAVLTLLSGLAAGLDRRAAGFGGLAERGRLVRRFAAAVGH